MQPTPEHREMVQDVLASRLAQKFRTPVIAVTIGAVVLVGGNLALLVPDSVALWLTAIVGAPAILLFLCATLDRRFQNALSVMNAQRRAKARVLGLPARLAGIGLPVGDRLLAVLSGCVIFEGVLSGFLDHRSAAALSVAAIALVILTNMSLMIRGVPTDRFVGIWS